MTPGPRWANRESLPRDGLFDVCAVLGWRGRAALVTAAVMTWEERPGDRQVGEGFKRRVTRALQRLRAQPICEVPPLVAVRAQPLWDAASGAVMRHM